MNQYRTEAKLSRWPIRLAPSAPAGAPLWLARGGGGIPAGLPLGSRRCCLCGRQESLRRGDAGSGSCCHNPIDSHSGADLITARRRARQRSRPQSQARRETRARSRRLQARTLMIARGGQLSGDAVATLALQRRSSAGYRGRWCLIVLANNVDGQSEMARSVLNFHTARQ